MFFEAFRDMLKYLKCPRKGLLIVAFLMVIFGSLAVFLVVDERIKLLAFFDSGWGFAIRFVTNLIVFSLTILLIDQAAQPLEAEGRSLKSLLVSTLKKSPNVLAVNLGMCLIAFLVSLSVALFIYFGETVIYGRYLYKLFNYYMLTLIIFALVMIFNVISNYYFAVFYAIIRNTPVFEAFSFSRDLLKKRKKPILIQMTIFLLVNIILLTPMVFFINKYFIFLPLLIVVMIFNVFYVVLFTRFFIKLDSNPPEAAVNRKPLFMKVIVSGLTVIMIGMLIGPGVYTTTSKDYKIVEKIFLENGQDFSRTKFESITDVKANRVISLDLSERNISIIPDEIGLLNELKKINISHNKIKELPNSISQLSNLESLDVHDNELLKLPDTFNQLKKLVYLYIRANPIAKLPPDFGKLQHLRTFSFSNLESFSNNFSDLGLRYVSFGDDIKTTTIPLELLANINIESLTVGGDNFVKIPAEIGNLKNLVDLSLNGSFTEIPESLGNLAALESLTLKGNYKELPNTISGMTSLNVLILKSKKLITLPVQIYDLKNLEEIDLDRNYIRYLPDGISKLKSLRVLYLDENLLTGLPADLFETNYWNEEDYVLSIRGNKICNVTDKQDEWLKTYISPSWRDGQICK